jgi:glycosyltransferase involved in cell wall biosynthesis
MAKILIYDLKTEGHHIEYLHHLYVGALHHHDDEFVFAVGKDFEKRSIDFQWDKSKNIKFIYLENEEGEGNVLRKSWRMNRQLRRTVKEERPDKVFLNTLMNFMPFLPYSVGKSKVSGIIYSIYLHDLASASRLGKLSNRLKYSLLTRKKSIENVFILNDSDSVEKLNEIWKTDKFKYLTDPYIPFDNADIRDLRNELGIADDKRVIAHLGYLEERKGTLEVLDMIENTSDEECKRYCVVFAGRIDNDIKDRFFNRIEILKNKIQIVTKIEFLPYDFMGSLVYTADKVVLPYRIVNASSGIIGYCAQFKTPVYVPAKGLIGKLVEDFHIGRAVGKFCQLGDLEDVDIKDCNYCESHTVEAFIDDIYKEICYV